MGLVARAYDARDREKESTGRRNQFLMRNPEYRRLAASLGRLREEDGQDMAEYVVLVSLIAMVVLAAAVFLGHTIAGLFDQAIGLL